MKRLKDTELVSNAASEHRLKHDPSPKRVAAGKRNRLLRKGLTPEGRQSLEEAARAKQPWRFSTGPRTAPGKAKAALNGKRRQIGPRSVRERRADLAELRTIADALRSQRRLINA
jgi:hypothetical protein